MLRDVAQGLARSRGAEAPAPDTLRRFRLALSGHDDEGLSWREACRQADISRGGVDRLRWSGWGDPNHQPTPRPARRKAAPPPPPPPLVAFDGDGLALRAQAGDRAAFDALYEHHHRAILNHVVRVLGHVGDSADAYDLTQDAFLKAWLKMPRADFTTCRFLSWLYVIATNVCRDELRHRRIIRWTSLDRSAEWAMQDDGETGSFFGSWDDRAAPDDIEQALLDREGAADILLTIERLPAHYRRALLHRIVHVLSDSDLATVMGVTRPTVKGYLYRARQLFREHYAQVQAGAS